MGKNKQSASSLIRGPLLYDGTEIKTFLGKKSVLPSRELKVRKNYWGRGTAIAKELEGKLMRYKYGRCMLHGEKLKYNQAFTIAVIHGIKMETFWVKNGTV